METITVCTSGNFMLIDRYSGKEIPHEGTATVPMTEFIRERLANGDLITPPEPIVEEPRLREGETPRDADGDGHDDKTGEFVEGNQAAKRRGRK